MKFSQKNNISNVINVGYIDAAIRLVVGMVGLAVFFVYSKYGMNYWLAAVALLSVYPLLTSFCLCDPVYEWIGFSTNKGGSENESSIDNFLSQSFQYLHDGRERASNDSTGYDFNYMPDNDRAA